MAGVLSLRTTTEITQATGRVVETGTDGEVQASLAADEVVHRQVSCAADAVTVLWSTADTVQDFERLEIYLRGGPASVMLRFKIAAGGSPNGFGVRLTQCGPFILHGDDAYTAWTVVPSDGSVGVITEVAVVNLDEDDAATIELLLAR